MLEQTISPELAELIAKGVPVLGEPTHPSPLLNKPSVFPEVFRTEEDRVLLSPLWRDCQECRANGKTPLTYEMAGPHRKIFFEPGQTRAAIVSCGGLCPGINDVIRALVLCLFHDYGVNEIYGIRYGYRGMVEGIAEPPELLKPNSIEWISMEGGTYLGTSRGNQDPVQMVDYLQRRKIGILFAIGGDGTQKGALAIESEARQRGYPLSVIGLPKTIDNDIGLIERTFGFDTAVSLATQVLRGAHVEAQGAINGVVIVKLMGRQSGFLAASAALASGDVNFALIPEIPFELDGPKGLLEALHQRLKARGHALVVVAEGVAERLMMNEQENLARDASGNLILEDIGTFLLRRIKEHFRSIKFEANIRYLDPSYYVRSLQAIPQDSIFCLNLAQHAVHAAMAGKTRALVGTCNGVHCLFPLDAVVQGRKFVVENGALWRAVLETTGQPARMLNA